MDHLRQSNRIHEDHGTIQENTTHPILPTHACVHRPQYSPDTFKMMTEQHLRQLPIDGH